MQPHPYQNLHWYPLTNNNNIWPKISVAYFTKWFQSIFTVGAWRMYPFSLSLLLAAYIPTQSCKRASFWSLNPVRARNSKPKPGSSPTFIFEAQLLESQIYRGSWDMRNCGVTKNVVCRCSCRYTLYHTENSNHLDQNIGIIWHKSIMLVNHNTAEYNVFQEKKKLIRNYLRWPYRHKRNFLGYCYKHEKPACRLLKTSQESREWFISLRKSHRDS